MRVKAFDKFQRQVLAGQTQTNSPSNRQASSRITYRSPECKQSDKDRILSSFNKQILIKPPSARKWGKAERSPNTTERSTVHDLQSLQLDLNQDLEALLHKKEMVQRRLHQKKLQVAEKQRDLSSQCDQHRRGLQERKKPDREDAEVEGQDASADSPIVRHMATFVSRPGSRWNAGSYKEVTEVLDKRYVRTLEKQKEFNHNFKNFNLVVQANPKILSTDMQTKFKLLDNFSGKFAAAEKADKSVLESEIIKLKNVEFTKELNKYVLQKLSSKLKHVQHSPSYNLRKRDARSRTIAQKKTDNSRNYYNNDGSINVNWKGLTVDDFRRYFCDFDAEMRETQSKEFVEKAHLETELREEAADSESSNSMQSDLSSLLSEMGESGGVEEEKNEVRTMFDDLKGQQRSLGRLGQRRQRFNEAMDKLVSLKRKASRGGFNIEKQLRAYQLEQQAQSSQRHDKLRDEIKAKFRRLAASKLPADSDEQEMVLDYLLDLHTSKKGQRGMATQEGLDPEPTDLEDPAAAKSEPPQGTSTPEPRLRGRPSAFDLVAGLQGPDVS